MTHRDNPQVRLSAGTLCRTQNIGEARPTKHKVPRTKTKVCAAILKTPTASCTKTRSKVPHIQAHVRFFGRYVVLMLYGRARLYGK